MATEKKKPNPRGQNRKGKTLSDAGKKKLAKKMPKGSPGRDGKGGFGDNPANRNINGRPLKGTALSDMLRDYLERENTEGVFINYDGHFAFDKDSPLKLKLKNKELLARALIRAGLEGNTSAFTQIFERLEGKVTQHIKLGEALEDLALDEIQRRETAVRARLAKVTA